LAIFSSLGQLLIWGVFSTITEVTQNFGLLISDVKVIYKFRENVDWAPFWVIFLKTHLVTLDVSVLAICYTYLILHESTAGIYFDLKNRFFRYF
jgi:hypothetical protein